MTVGFKISHRLAIGFVAALGTAGSAACTIERPTGSSSDPVFSITVSPQTADLDVSNTLKLAVVVYDARGQTLSGRTITWRSDAEAIATVSSDGTVSAADSGMATISASSEGKTAFARVNVHRKPVPPPPPLPTEHVGFFAFPGGSTGADGTKAHPWSLTTALSNPGGQIQPGDTLWLLGGTYQGNFRSSLTGTASKPIVVRAYPGQRAIIDGAQGTSGASTWYVNGAYSVFWGLELINSDPNRTLALGDKREDVVANYASHTKYIDLIVHDGGVGIYNESPYYDVEVVGSIFYNIGYQSSDRGHGHAIYLRSNTGPVTACDNIMFNQYGYGVHVFTNPGEGQLLNIHLEGNIAFNNGTLSNNSNSSNILFGGDDYASGGVVKDNFLYESPGVPGPNMEVGYGSTHNGSVDISGNYVASGGTVLDVGYWSSLTASNNFLIGTGTILRINDPSISASTFSGQTESSLPTTTKVVVRPNPYETGRANIAVFNWGGQSSAPVDLSGIVPAGAHYQIRNVQDLFGTPVVSDTYQGGVVTLPLRGVTPPVPIGLSSSRAPSTGTAFNAYIVTIQ
jgi:hypothetical protein